MVDLSGRCLCGDVRWTASGSMKWKACCHCESCRRATSAPFVPLFGIDNDKLQWDGPLAVFHSSENVERGHCRNCGTALFYRNDLRWPNETHIPAVTLDDPSTYEPKAHVYYEERLPWLELRDGLPKFIGTGDDGKRPLTDEEAHAPERKAG